LYGLAYRNLDKKVGFKLTDAVPHSGPSDARVVFVEFFDYGCPACKQFKSVIEIVAAAYPQDVVVYYKQFPLAGHPDSDEAAAAAVAAHRQGKFKGMHDLLFANQYKHKMEDLRGYAKQIGLDMGKFEADFKAAVEQVAADKAEGGEHVKGTPTIFLNGRVYEGPAAPKYLKLFVEEELAVNQ
ncbi:MAG: thioredoxin domain-containing protein, partial [Deltaproteobacteria bacterium]|nr:thioredoxin domain-containing protein [Deltaproteobacteria bacterium]